MPQKTLKFFLKIAGSLTLKVPEILVGPRQPIGPKKIP